MSPDVHAFTVGPIQENAYIVRANPEASSALMIDPGEESQRLLYAAASLGVSIEAILITHCHFDHVGAVAPLARATGAPVYCPELELAVLADITKWTMPGFGPFESWQAEQTVKGGERLTLAGMDIDVIFTPGHSPGHVTYAITTAGENTVHASEHTTNGSSHLPGSNSTTPQGASNHSASVDIPALLAGDVLFQGSVGRVDLPGGDWPTLERSIGTLMERFPRDATVYPGHMGTTTLGREWDTNPFLSELRACAISQVPAQAQTS